MDYLLWAIVHFGSLALVLTTAAGVGHLALRRQRFHSRLEGAVFTLMCGLGLCALAIFCLGLAGLLYRPVLLGLTLLGTAVTIFYFVRAYLRAQRRPRLAELVPWKELLRPRTLWVLLLLLIGLYYWLLQVRLPQYPPISWDAVAYHLPLAKEYLRQHRIVMHEGVTLPVVPALNHVLFVWAMALKDDIVAQLLEHTIMMLTALGLLAWGWRCGRRMMGLALASFWLGQPLVGLLGESGYVDAGLACFAFLSVYALRVFWDEGARAWWLLALLLGAMAGSVKFQGMFFLAGAALLGLWACWRARLSWQTLLQGAALSFVFILPWLAFIAYHTGGNPIWPAGAPLSHGIWRAGAESVWQAWHAVGVPKTLWNFLSLPYLITFRLQTFLPDSNRALLPLIVAFPLAWIIAFFNRSVRWWTIWALAFTGFWFSSTQQIRFWVSALPLVGLALYESLQWLLDKTWKAPTFQALIWLALALYAFETGARPARELVQFKAWPPPVSAEQRQQMLTNITPGYAAVNYINRYTAPGDKLYLINGSWLTYYLEPKVLDIAGVLQPVARPTLRWPEDEPWVRQLDAKNVKWVLVLYKDVLEMARLPKEHPAIKPYWPDFELVYADQIAYVFRRKPVPDEIVRVNVPKKRPSLIPEAHRGTVTVGVYRPSLAAFLLRNSNTPGTFEMGITYGLTGDLLIVGDWNGDGIQTIGVYRPGDNTFYLRNNNSNGLADLSVTYGTQGDLPVAGDWDGDGIATIGVYRPSTATFYLRNSNTSGGADLTINFGQNGDIPLAGDWDGDGIATIGVYRPATRQFLLRNSNSAGKPDVVVAYGAAGDIPLVGDWDGNGTATIGVFRPASSEFLLRNDNKAGAPDMVINYGVAGDRPVVGDWDGK